MARTPLDIATGLACADVLHSRFEALPPTATIADVRRWFAASSHRRMAFLADGDRYLGQLTRDDVAGRSTLAWPRPTSRAPAPPSRPRRRPAAGTSSRLPAAPCASRAWTEMDVCSASSPSPRTAQGSAADGRAVLRVLVTFAPVAGLLTLTPGATTALVVRNALRGGRRHAFLTTSGTSVGVLVWGCCAAAGVAAIVAASSSAFDVIKLVGAVVLVVMGARSLLGSGHLGSDAAPSAPALVSDRRALRDGLITSLANPKLAVFFVALFPQFVPRGTPVLPATLAMVGVLVSFDLIWYSVLAALVSRAKRRFVEGRWARRMERLTGAVLVGLGVRLALERR